jgi:hypothetical protein
MRLIRENTILGSAEPSFFLFWAVCRETGSLTNLRPEQRNFRFAGKPGLTTFQIAFENGMCKLAGQLLRFVTKDESWTTF